MWLDNASNIDMLFYSPYAETIAGFAKNSDLTPLTIGLYGSWGAGKSSLLNLIEKQIKSNYKDVICISLNAWQFEGYEDAKVAIMESLLKNLIEKKSDDEGFKGKVKNLLKRIDFLKLGKDLAKKGLPYALGALTGNPIPIALNFSASLKDGESIVEGIENFKDKYLKSEETETQTENVRRFKEEFEKILDETQSITNLVVIVDDLDRCTPDRIIDTLEAIKLFLSVKKTTFIVAVDQGVIEYAVNIKYPQVKGVTLSSDYIEKIIQLPIKIPELSSKDIENYLLLLMCQLHIDEDSFNNLILKIYEKRIMLEDKTISLETIKNIIDEVGCSFKQNYNIESLTKECEIILKISNVVSASLKGNPRQSKRFLNTFFVRKSLASLYFGDEFDLSIMAKLLALETIDSSAFRKLYEWNSEFNGSIKQLEEIENAVLKGKEINENYASFDKPRLIRWIKSEPNDLSKYDLSKYFYLSRDSLISSDDITSKFSDGEKKVLSEFQNCIQGRENHCIEMLNGLSRESQRKVIEAIVTSFKDDKIIFGLISRLYKGFADYRIDIIDAIKLKDSDFFNISAIPHFMNMRADNKEQIDSLLDELLEKKKIEHKFKEAIVGVDPIATTVRRS